MLIHINKKFFEFKTFGQSMQPLFRDGDVIEIRKITFPKIKVDDVITFIREENLISHRVVYKTDKYLLTAGDNNQSVDKKVIAKDIFGKVVSITRGNEKIQINSIYLYQSSIYWEEIVKIKKIFDKMGIEYIFLKGLPLYLYYEKKIPQRIYADCDILLAEKDITKAADLLEKMGYQKRLSHNSFLPAFLEKGRPENTFNKRVKKVIVSLDVHTEMAFLMKTFGDLGPIYPKYLINNLTQRAFEKKQIISIENEKFPVLKLPQLIIYLALHLFSHNLKGYNRYELLSYLLKNRKVDYEELSAEISNFKLNSYILPVFLILKKYYKVNFPQNFIKDINPGIEKTLYIKRSILNKKNPFGVDKKWERGSDRFKHIFYLSPNKLTKKIFIFFKPHIIYAIFWVLFHKAKSVTMRSE